MRLTAALFLALALATAVVVWASGGLAEFAWWAQGRQRALQDALGAEISALRTGGAAAVWGLMAACGAYGFLHALGPGHGKALIAGAALGTRATAGRMALIAVAGSLAQAGVAIALVYGGFALLDATARSLSEGTERWAAPVGNLAVALIGAWILARGLQALPRATAPAPGHADHGHGRGCGHAHGPSAAEAAQATSLGATLALIGAMAARPCTGAIFVLAIAWRMGLPSAGAAGALAMGLGTAGFTVLVAWLAVTSREAALLSAGAGGSARLLGPGLQIATGAIVLAGGGLLFLAGLAA